MASKYKVTVTYDDGYTKDFTFTIPAFPGTYHFNFKEECEPSDMNPDGYISYAPIDIEVGKEQKEYNLHIKTQIADISVADRFVDYDLRFKTPSLALEDLTWAEIAKISEAGKAKEVFSIGDTKTLGGVFGTAVIVGFDHDDLYDGGKAGITFALQSPPNTSVYNSIFSGMVADPLKMITSTSDTGCWGSSKMLNETMAALGSVSPFTTIGKYIKYVNKIYYTWDSSYKPIASTATSRFFLFSYQEVKDVGETSILTNEGALYEYWKNNTIKNTWLRTVYPGEQYKYYYADTSGTIGYKSGTNTNPIIFGFCI